MQNYKDYINGQLESLEEPEKAFLDEKMYFDYKTRDGKRVKKWHTTRENYRIQINKKTGQPKEVYISPTERLKRKIGQRKAAIKRKSKQRNITAKRLKSFGVRTKAGMRYNTKGHIAKDRGKIGKGDYDRENAGLYPNMLESLLLEWPHIEILPDIFWDFYSEVDDTDSTWIMQLADLCSTFEMHSLREGEPGDQNNCPEAGTHDGIIKITPDELDQVLLSISSETLAMNAIAHAYKNLSAEDREVFDSALNGSGHEGFVKRLHA